MSHNFTDNVFGDRPLSQPRVAQRTDACMRHSACRCDNNLTSIFYLQSLMRKSFTRPWPFNEDGCIACVPSLGWSLVNSRRDRVPHSMLWYIAAYCCMGYSHTWTYRLLSNPFLWFGYINIRCKRLVQYTYRWLDFLEWYRVLMIAHISLVMWNPLGNLQQNPFLHKNFW